MTASQQTSLHSAVYTHTEGGKGEKEKEHLSWGVKGAQTWSFVPGMGVFYQSWNKDNFNSSIHKYYRDILSETKDKAFAVGKGENESCDA